MQTNQRKVNSGDRFYYLGVATKADEPSVHHFLTGEQKKGGIRITVVRWLSLHKSRPRSLAALLMPAFQIPGNAIHISLICLVSLVLRIRLASLYIFRQVFSIYEGLLPKKKYDLDVLRLFLQGYVSHKVET